MNRTFKIDWFVLLIYLLLVSFGITTIYSSTFDANQPELFNLSRSIGKQMVFFIVSLAAGIFILAAPVKIFERFASVFYLAIILLLIGFVSLGSTISVRDRIALAVLACNPQNLQKWL